jgi:hypothetical protein
MPGGGRIFVSNAKNSIETYLFFAFFARERERMRLRAHIRNE